MGLHKQSYELEQEVLSVTHDKQRLDDELSVIEQLCAEETSGFTVVQPATESLGSPTSNKRKLLFALSLVTGLVLSRNAIVLLEVAHRRESPLTMWARRLGLPLLVQENSPVTVAEDDFGTRANYDAMRLLALRIQQSVKRPGSTFLFLRAQLPANALTGCYGIWPVVCRSRRQGRVLIVHSGSLGPCGREVVPEPMNERRMSPSYSLAGRNGASRHGEPATVEPDVHGLAAYLTAGSLDLEGLVEPTHLADVDQLQAGDCPLPREAWGTLRMNELLYRLRERYSLILFCGPTVEQPVVDLPPLAARVDGIIFSMPDKNLVSPNAAAVIRDSTQMQAPILGLIA